MPSHALEELKSLRYKRSDTSPFESHTAFREWSDRAIPLLAFDKGTQASFKSAVTTAEALNEMSGIGYPVRAVNEAMGILNQAADALELREKEAELAIVSTDCKTLWSTLEPPPKVTIRWLIDHLPIPLAVAAGTVLISAFTLGLAFSETQMYALLRAKATNESTNTTSKNANVTDSAPTNSKSIASAPK